MSLGKATNTCTVRRMGTSLCLSTFVKGHNFVDDLFVSLEVEALSKGAHF